MEYKFKEKWNEDVEIDWWRKSRIQLNSIINVHNTWQMEGCPEDKSELVLIVIEYGKQTIGSQDGGSGYWDELDDMETFVRGFC